MDIANKGGRKQCLASFLKDEKLGAGPDRNPEIDQALDCLTGRAPLVLPPLDLR